MEDKFRFRSRTRSAICCTTVNTSVKAKFMPLPFMRSGVVLVNGRPG